MPTESSSPGASAGANLHHQDEAGNTQHEDKVLLVLTLIIGAVVGVVVVAFILLTENLGARLYPAGAPAWRRVLVPVFGALITGFLLHRYFPNARGSGIPQTKTALFLRDGYISFRTVLGKFGLCSISLASGIALGREGPSVHVGAGIASSLGRRLGLSPASIKALVPTGASAALAAAFNTPISAVLFSLEEVMGDMHAPVLGSIVLGSATSWIVLHLILGDEPLFHVPAYQLVHPVEFVFYAALGVLGGLVSAAFVKLLLWQRKHFLRAPRSAVWLMPAVGGLTVGVLGWFYPEVLGVGYSFVGKALNGQMLIGTMALLVVLKIIATSTCYASGNAGGIFGPSLFMGAMMGGAVGGVAHILMPDYTGSVGAYALVGMGTAFAGIVRVPLTSVIMVFEITRDYSIIVPLMIANLISYFISSKLQREPIYEALQHQDGISLPSGSRARQNLLMVGHAYRPEAQILAASERIGQAAASVDRQRGAWPVVDEAGFRGMVTADQFDTAIAAGLEDSTLAQIVPKPAGTDSLSESSVPHVYADDSLDVAMRSLAGGKIPVLPVLSRLNPGELKGTISLPDVLAAYSVGEMQQDREPGLPSQPAKFSKRLLAGLLAMLSAVVILGWGINYFYRTELRNRAVHYTQAGNDLLKKGRYPEAVEQYRNALSTSHSTGDRLALGLALVESDQTGEAAIYLNEVLHEQPGSGPANLGTARIDMADGNVDDAVLHLKRAIVGSWPEDAAQNRLKAHFQLVGYLSKQGRQEQAKAELLSLNANLPQDLAIQRQAGNLLVQFGLAKEAVERYGNILKADSPDAADYDGLGAALFALGDYQQAIGAFHEALKFDPSDELAASRAKIADQILALDPSDRGIASRERYTRSQDVLKNVLNSAVTCFGAESSWTATLKADVGTARAELVRKKAPASFSDAMEANIALAEALWKARNASCPPVGGNDPVALVLGKLAAR
jgi:CIC family chloride channel protein